MDYFDKKKDEVCGTMMLKKKKEKEQTKGIQFMTDSEIEKDDQKMAELVSRRKCGTMMLKARRRRGAGESSEE